MVKRRLGATGPEVSAVGLGCMAMSNAYGPADESEAVATVRAALDSGVTLVDTGDSLVGARTLQRLTESLAALELALADADLVAIEQAIRPGEVHGSRYAEAQMAHLDSEA
jgi:aryl-alcohol dehydrogenase-like predicted oxidoreductase